MYLHNNKELFTEVITEVNAQTGIAGSIIERDYYVTMILKLLARSNPDIVFKGGTSLSKCFHLINRFSEDIYKIVYYTKNLLFSFSKPSTKSVVVAESVRARKVSF